MTGTLRRLRALVAIGYSQKELAQRLGMRSSNLSSLIQGARPRVSTKTHAAASTLFIELWAHPVLGNPGDRSRTIARSHGWVGPLAWDDIDDPTEIPNVDGAEPHQPATERLLAAHEGSTAGTGPTVEAIDASIESEPVESELIDEIAIELAIRGEHVRLTTAERHIAVTRLHSYRWSDNLIAATLGVADRTILRDRDLLGLEAFPFSEIRQVGAA